MMRRTMAAVQVSLGRERLFPLFAARDDHDVPTA
jgi:hypothetical protein